jgi:hypothetical protein
MNDLTPEPAYSARRSHQGTPDSERDVRMIYRMKL